MKNLRGLLPGFLLGVALTAGIGGYILRDAIFAPPNDEDRFSGKTTAQWIALLKDKDMSTRRDAVIAVGRIGVPAAKAAPDLAALAKDEESGVQIEAIVSLSKLGVAGKETTGVLHEILCSHKDASTRLAAATAIGKIGNPNKETIGCLMDALDDPSAHVRSAAAQSLASFGKDAVPAFKKGLVNEDRRVRFESAAGLSLIGPDAKDAVPNLVALLKDPGLNVRKAAIHALGEISDGKDGEILAILIKLDPDPEALVRRVTVEALSVFGPDEEKAVAPIMRHLKDADGDVRECAAKCLGNFGPLAKKAIPDLTALLADKDSDVRAAAATTLGEIGPDAKDSVAALNGLSKDTDEEVRDAAKVAVAKITVMP